MAYLVLYKGQQQCSRTDSISIYQYSWRLSSLSQPTTLLLNISNSSSSKELQDLDAFRFFFKNVIIFSLLKKSVFLSSEDWDIGSVKR